MRVASRFQPAGTHSKGRVSRYCKAIGAGDWVYPIVNIIIFNKTGKFTCIVLLNDDVGGIFPPPATHPGIKKPLTAVTIKGSK